MFTKIILAVLVVIFVIAAAPNTSFAQSDKCVEAQKQQSMNTPRTSPPPECDIPHSAQTTNQITTSSGETNRRGDGQTYLVPTTGGIEEALNSLPVPVVVIAGVLIVVGLLLIGISQRRRNLY